MSKIGFKANWQAAQNAIINRDQMDIDHASLLYYLERMRFYYQKKVKKLEAYKPDKLTREAQKNIGLN